MNESMLYFLIKLKNMKRILFFVIVVFSITITHAQSAYKGTLLNEKGEPIFGANVIQLTLKGLSVMIKVILNYPTTPKASLQ